MFKVQYSFRVIISSFKQRMESWWQTLMLVNSGVSLVDLLLCQERHFLNLTGKILLPLQNCFGNVSYVTNHSHFFSLWRNSIFQGYVIACLLFRLLKCFFPIFVVSVNKGQVAPIDCEILTRELLDSTKCYLLDCGSEIYAWMGRETTLEERKRAGSAAEVTLSCFCMIFLLLLSPTAHGLVIL